MRILTAVVQAVLVGVVVWGFAQMLMDGLEEWGNRLWSRFRTRKPGLLALSNAIRKP